MSNGSNIKHSKFDVYFKLIKKFKKRIAFFTMLALLVGMVIMYFLSYKIKDEYRAGITVFASYDEDNKKDSYILDYANLLTGYSVSVNALKSLDKDDIDVEDIRDNISFDVKEKSNTMDIYVSYCNEEEAKKIVGAVANSFIDEVKKVTKKDNIKLLDENIEIIKTRSFDKMFIWLFLIYAICSFLISTVLVVIKASTSKKINLVGECSLDGELEIIGVLPDFKKIK